MFLKDEDTLEAQKQWNTTPCGSGDYLAGLEYGSLAYFDEVRRNRYMVTDPWMAEKIDFTIAKGKKLLEIGHGMGTDLLTFAEAGAEVYGIDITEEHHHLAKRNFELHQQSCVLKLCNCTDIDFPSDFFDYVYSNGVLHHTPFTVRCISEAYRVLKPGGRLIFSMYYTFSAFHIFSMLLYRGVWQGQLRKLGYKGLMSTDEHGADGITIKPLVKTYRKTQLEHILADFTEVRFQVAHFRGEHIPKFGKFFSPSIEKHLEPYLGWYLIAYATK